MSTTLSAFAGGVCGVLLALGILVVANNISDRLDRTRRKRRSF